MTDVTIEKFKFGKAIVRQSGRIRIQKDNRLASAVMIGAVKLLCSADKRRKPCEKLYVKKLIKAGEAELSWDKKTLQNHTIFRTCICNWHFKISLKNLTTQKQPAASAAQKNNKNEEHDKRKEQDIEKKYIASSAA